MIESIQILGSIGEFVGAIGVVATLVYLSVQIRHSTKSTKALTFSNATNAWQDYLLEQSVEDLELMMRLATDQKQLSHGEFLRVYYLYRVMFRRMENDFYQHRAGTFDENTWEAYVTSWEQDTFAAPAARAMWNLQSPMFNAEFVKTFDDIVARSLRTPVHQRREFEELLREESVPG